ncbi:site-specific integrase [Bordetella sp. J329]|nr:site-specific integrase [Bordetella sp. J329]
MGGKRRGVRAASESSIEISFVYEGQRCRERIPLKPTAANLKRADAHRGAILYAIENGTFDYETTFPNSQRVKDNRPVAQGPDTIENFLSRWLDEKKPTVSASTYAGYRSIILGAIIPGVGREAVASLSRRRIREWLSSYADQRPDITNKRLSNIQSCLRSALSEALEADIIEINPLAGWTYRRKMAPKEQDDVDPFSPAEQTEILAQLDPDAQQLIQFAFWTGLRTSEIIALEWGDIDWLSGSFDVRRAITKAAQGTPESTKTSSGRRTVKLLAPALAVLTKQRETTLLNKRGFVFLNETTGERWTDGSIYKRWGTALKRARVRYRRPYQTRHTYASMMLSAGEHPMWVAQQMGHADWTMIARVYGKWMPDANLDAGNRATALFAPVSDNKKDNISMLS